MVGGMLTRTHTNTGPVFDCVVFNDGSKWRAVVDTNSDGDLSSYTPMTNFKDGRQYATIGGINLTKDSAALLNYAVNIYDVSVCMYVYVYV